jgi:hypothetical protein
MSDERTEVLTRTLQRFGRLQRKPADVPSAG